MGSGRFVRGHFFSEKLNRDMYYRSSYELELLRQLEDDPDVIYYDTEANRIPYEYESVEHSYVPDVYVWYEDCDYEVIEVKPECFLDDPVNIAKFEAAEAIYGEHFVILTEKEIFA